MGIKVFLLTETDTCYQWLRRYSSIPEGGTPCPVTGSYHNAMIAIEDGAVDADGYIRCNNEEELRKKYQHDWPLKCECGYEFTEEDSKQIFQRRKYKDEAGTLYTLENAPIGAMWDAHWYHDVKGMVGEDGKSLIVKLPNGHDWVIDQRASNCDSPCKHCGVPYHSHSFEKQGHHYEDARPHKCWVRHGEPPHIHVDKNGITCGAGAGSIASGTPGKDYYHGYLHNGELVPA